MSNQDRAGHRRLGASASPHKAERVSTSAAAKARWPAYAFVGAFDGRFTRRPACIWLPARGSRSLPASISAIRTPADSFTPTTAPRSVSMPRDTAFAATTKSSLTYGGWPRGARLHRGLVRRRRRAHVARSAPGSRQAHRADAGRPVVRSRMSAAELIAATARAGAVRRCNEDSPNHATRSELSCPTHNCCATQTMTHEDNGAILPSDRGIQSQYPLVWVRPVPIALLNP